MPNDDGSAAPTPHTRGERPTAVVATRPGAAPTARLRRAGPQARFTIVALVAVALILLTHVALVGTEQGQRTENLALLGAEFRTPSERERAIERLAAISTTTFGFAVVGLLLVALARRRAALGVTVAGAMLASVLLAEALKDVLPRPELVTGPVWLLRNSFPSGTAAVAAAVAVGGLVVAPGRLRWIALPVGIVYAAAVGEATQATGWHRLSDVVGGTLLVIAVASIGLAVLAAAGLVQPARDGAVDRRIRNALAVIALIALLFGGALLAATSLFPLLLSPVGSRRAFLQTAFPLLGAGLTVAFLLAFARAVEPWSLGEGQPPSKGGNPTLATRNDGPPDGEGALGSG